MASENDTLSPERLPPGTQVLNLLKLAGEVAILPGTSLLMQGKVPQGATHAILGWLAKIALGPTAGTIGWLLLAANSYAKASSGKYMHDYVLDVLPDVDVDVKTKERPASEEAADRAKPRAQR